MINWLYLTPSYGYHLQAQGWSRQMFATRLDSWNRIRYACLTATHLLSVSCKIRMSTKSFLFSQHGLRHSLASRAGVGLGSKARLHLSSSLEQEQSGDPHSSMLLAGDSYLGQLEAWSIPPEERHFHPTSRHKSQQDLRRVSLPLLLVVGSTLHVHEQHGGQRHLL